MELAKCNGSTLDEVYQRLLRCPPALAEDDGVQLVLGQRRRSRFPGRMSLLSFLELVFRSIANPINGKLRR